MVKRHTWLNVKLSIRGLRHLGGDAGFYINYTNNFAVRFTMKDTLHGKNVRTFVSSGWPWITRRQAFNIWRLLLSEKVVHFLSKIIFTTTTINEALYFQRLCRIALDSCAIRFHHIEN